MAANNNAIGHQRNDQVLQLFRLGYKATAKQLVQAGIFPSEERARRKMNVLEKRKSSPVKHHGWYDDNGVMVKVWGIGHAGPNLAHRVELLNLALKLDVDDVLIGKRIPKDWRLKYDPDYVVVLNGRDPFFGEHDRASEDLDQVQARMKKLRDCPFDVLWDCPSEQRIGELIGEAPNNKHWFTTFAQATTNPHEKTAWKNAIGETAGVPKRLAVQLAVQSAASV
jgi:hypothetical protein